MRFAIVWVLPVPGGPCTITEPLWLRRRMIWICSSLASLPSRTSSSLIGLSAGNAPVALGDVHAVPTLPLCRRRHRRPGDLHQRRREDLALFDVVDDRVDGIGDAPRAFAQDQHRVARNARRIRRFGERQRILHEPAARRRQRLHDGFHQALGTFFRPRVNAVVDLCSSSAQRRHRKGSADRRASRCRARSGDRSRGC